MRELLKRFKKIIFFDTETTGLDPEKDQIIELAAALVTEKGIELKIDAFCKLPEGEKIPDKIVELTHITDDMLADKGIAYNEACRIFCNMIHSDGEALLVAHNIQFDLLFALEMFKRCGMVPKAPKLRALDTLTVYKDRAAYPHKLANAIEHYGLTDKVQNSHRAIDDVLALYEVTKAMDAEREDLADYIDLLGYNPKYGITGRKLKQITYLPQSYKLGCRLPDLREGGEPCE
ncbi:3'-5' exonuclease [Lacrimispora defluvii]|uniref:3'-5' exonuclease n=1 Tax=Lacrimispora defluvii TaxID=2719233 RepID=A0ABX1VPF6_9FIRM|nr:3'-5' exonuclease [Lacrimispora defluvii]NNJ30123.1 3'-5' exonuclease [Lacrimispora defluvii]